jgi:hypothetical protein
MRRRYIDHLESVFRINIPECVQTGTQDIADPSVDKMRTELTVGDIGGSDASGERFVQEHRFQIESIFVDRLTCGQDFGGIPESSPYAVLPRRQHLTVDPVPEKQSSLIVSN